MELPLHAGVALERQYWVQCGGLTAKRAALKRHPQFDDNAARERLKQLQLENEVRAQSFAVREKDLDIASRYREQALAEARAQVASLMKELALDRETMRAQVTRIIDLNAQVEDYRQQLATVVTRAVARHRVLANTALKRKVRTREIAKPRRPAALNKPKGRKRKLARKPR